MCSSLSLDQLDDRIAALAGEINALTASWLELVAEFERRDGHDQWGFATCAQWLSWRCGIVERAAREQVRVARRLVELPRIRAAFADGQLSYSKVRALTRVATSTDEPELLELAAHSTAAQLERLLRAYRGVLDPEAAERAQDDRYFSWSWEEDGSLSFHGRLPAEDGATLIRAIEAAGDGLRRDQRSAESGSAEPAEANSARPQPPVTNADAIVALGESALASGVASRSGGERYQLVVHLEPAILSGERSGGRCATDDGSPLAAETARRLACDAGIVPIVERAGRALSVGRRMRTVPPAIGRALRARDDGCRFPGCNHRRFVDAHHIRHWARGGETCLDNLVQLCRHHHRLVHEGGFRIEPAGGGKLVFRRPDGRRIGSVPQLRPQHGSALRVRPASRRRAGIRPAPPARARLDLDHIVGALVTAPGPSRRSREPG